MSVPDHDVVLLVGNNQTVVFNVERDSSQSDEDMWVQKSILFKKLSLKKDWIKPKFLDGSLLQFSLN